MKKILLTILTIILSAQNLICDNNIKSVTSEKKDFSSNFDISKFSQAINNYDLEKFTQEYQICKNLSFIQKGQLFLIIRGQIRVRAYELGHFGTSINLTAKLIGYLLMGIGAPISFYSMTKKHSYPEITNINNLLISGMALFSIGFGINYSCKSFQEISDTLEKINKDEKISKLVLMMKLLNQ